MEHYSDIVKQLKELYPEGTRVVLAPMDKTPPAGIQGTVVGFDDIGNVLVEWDDYWIRYRNFRVHTLKNEVYYNEKRIEMKKKEYQLLRFFLQHPHQKISYEMLYEGAWGEKYLCSSQNVVRGYIRKLRIMLEENPDKPKIIHTVWGCGYCFY